LPKVTIKKDKIRLNRKAVKWQQDSDVARPRPPNFSRPRPVRPRPRPLFQDQHRFFLKTIKLIYSTTTGVARNFD